jgi:hypothetical protein
VGELVKPTVSDRSNVGDMGDGTICATDVTRKLKCDGKWRDD